MKRTLFRIALVLYPFISLFSSPSSNDCTFETRELNKNPYTLEPIETPVEVQAQWWQTTWAILVWVLLLLGIALLVYQIVLCRARRKREELALKETLQKHVAFEEQKKRDDEMRNRFFILLVKELRQPLSLIIAPLKELSKEKSLPQDFSLKAQIAYRNSINLLDTCNQLSNVYTRIAVEDKLEIAPYPINKVIEFALSSVRELIAIQPIDFRYRNKTKKELEVWINKRQIVFLLHNLISNAFLHIRYSGIVTLSVAETVTEGGCPCCTITLTDNGSNAVIHEEEDKENLQTDWPRLELLMHVMKEIIQKHHGTVQIETDQGTTVQITLPTTKSAFEADPDVVFVLPEQLQQLPPVGELHHAPALPTEEQADVAPDWAKETTATPKKTLLVVEDHKEIRLYLNILFGKEYKMLMAHNGQEGVDIARKELPDLILCDVRMPVKDGFECCRELKEGLNTCHIPLIMLTARAEDEDVLQGLALGADDYLVKPFTPSILKAKVKNLIAGRMNLKQMYAKLLMLPTGSSEEAEEVPADEMQDPFIQSVIKRIEENLNQADFTVKKLAADLNMSQPTLYRKVKQSTDYTIIELIRGVRIKKAALLLKEKSYNVTEVAEMVGYNDIPTFRKHFVDTFGKTPSTYAD